MVIRNTKRVCFLGVSFFYVPIWHVMRAKGPYLLHGSIDRRVPGNKANHDGAGQAQTSAHKLERILTDQGVVGIVAQDLARVRLRREIGAYQ
jgi:hypothetical protein